MYLARRFAPAMVKAGKAAVIVTGNTSALRGRAGFAAFAPTKAAQRILGEAVQVTYAPIPLGRAVHASACRLRVVQVVHSYRRRDP
jgi:hypothetical protein